MTAIEVVNRFATEKQKPKLWVVSLNGRSYRLFNAKYCRSLQQCRFALENESGNIFPFMCPASYELEVSKDEVQNRRHCQK